MLVGSGILYCWLVVVGMARCDNSQTVKIFDTNRAEEKCMEQRNVKEKHNLEENGVEMGRQHLKRSEIKVRENMNWIYLAQDKRMWWALVNTQLNL